MAAFGSAAIFLGLWAAPSEALGTPQSTFAGYQYSTALTSETATFVLPIVSCAKNRTNVDAQLNANDTLNNSTNWAEMFVGCTRVNGALTAQYIPYLFIDGNSRSTSSLTFNPGDTISLGVTCGATGSGVSITDLTLSSSASSSSSTPSSCSGGLVGDYGPIQGLPAFSAVTWTNVEINGQTLQSVAPSGHNYYVKNKAMLAAGTIGLDGSSFTVTRGGGPYELYCPGSPVGNVVFNGVTTSGLLSPMLPTIGQPFSVIGYQTKVPIPSQILTAINALGPMTVTANAHLDTTGASPASLATGTLVGKVVAKTAKLPKSAVTLTGFTTTASSVAIYQDASLIWTWSFSGNPVLLACTAYPNNSSPSGTSSQSPAATPINPLVAVSIG